MKKTLLLVFMLGTVVTCKADDFSDLLTWVKSQQVNAGTSMGIKSSVKYAASWWDAVSIGQAGINIGKAGAKDYVDAGPYTAIANASSPRYGAALPIHVGTLWNAINLPPTIASHVILKSVPNFILSPAFLWPVNKSLNKWRWDQDFQVALAYTFGGS